MQDKRPFVPDAFYLRYNPVEDRTEAVAIDRLSGKIRMERFEKREDAQKWLAAIVLDPEAVRTDG